MEAYVALSWRHSGLTWTNGMDSVRKERKNSMAMIPRSLLHCVVSIFSLGVCIHASDLHLESPSDFQVFQRASRDEGIVRVMGHADFEGAQWQYRIVGKSREGKPVDETWHAFPSALRDGNFDFTAPAPAGGWYRVEVRASQEGKAVGEANVEHVGVGEVFIVAGQSNAGSYGSERQTVKSGLVSGFDGKTWAIANDPQRGAGGAGGSFLPAFGDAMAARFGVPIGVVPIAAGGTSVRQWLPKGIPFAQQTTTGNGIVQTADGQWESDGALFQRLSQRLSALGEHGARAILWHQGESDAGQARGGAPADRQISGEQYAAFMEALIRASREKAGWNVPWFTAQTTYHSEKDLSDDEFRAAQKAAWEKGLALPGPDTDPLRAEYRTGVHFNGIGLRKHGELWAEKVGAWLDGQLQSGEPAR